MQHARKRTHLVAQRRGFLEAQLARRLLHAGLELAHHVFGFAIQKAHRALHVAFVFRRFDRAHAGRRTAPDLMQQTGPRAVGEDGVLTGAQPKDLLQDLDGFPHGPGVGERPEVLAPLVRRAAIVGDARPFMARS
ncbi:hypothetical protein G6F59_016911 [Rhizopus arrhizus]|nr:hypothetical protein G6F59_016911 [Rhizopus arrhizus]